MRIERIVVGAEVKFNGQDFKTKFNSFQTSRMMSASLGPGDDPERCMDELFKGCRDSIRRAFHRVVNEQQQVVESSVPPDVFNRIPRDPDIDFRVAINPADLEDPFGEGDTSDA